MKWRFRRREVEIYVGGVEICKKNKCTSVKISKSDEERAKFWSGRKAKELGLIDGIGNADQILKEKFGDDVIIKKFEKAKGWLARKLSSESSTEQVINILEERSIWQRYGF